MGTFGTVRVYIGEVAVGFIIGWASPTISKLQSFEETPLSATIDNGQASILGGTIIVGVIFGAQFAAHLCNIKGRRYCFVIGGLTCIASFLLLAVSTELWMLMLGRTLRGVGAGPVYILNMTYIAEVSSNNNRGVFLTGTGTANALGIVFAYSIGPYISYSAINYVGLLLCTLSTAGLLYIPETPAFNVMKDNGIKAKKTLLQLGRSEEIEDVLSVTTSNKKHPCASLAAIVSTMSNRKAFMIAVVLLVLQQGTLGFFFYVKSIKPQLAEEVFWLPLLSLVIFLMSYATVYIGELAIGFLAGWTSPVISKLQSSEETPLSATIDNGQASILGATLIVGIIFGAQFSGFLSNMKGRRYCLIIGGLTCTASFLLLAVSTELWMLMLGRTLLGVGAGPVYILNMTYIAEVSSKNNRGVFLTGIGTANALGMVFVYSIGPYISYSAMNYVGLLMSAMFTVGLLYIPETPAFNVMKGNDIKAKKTLLQLGRNEEIEDVLSVTTSNKKHPCASLTAIVSTRSNRKAFMIAAVLLVLQQMSGRLCVILYGTSIFESAGSTITPALATIGVGLSELVASCISPLIARKVGRKAILLVSTAVCCLSLGTLGFFFYVKSIKPQLAEEVFWLPLLSLVIFLLSHTTGFGIIPNALMSEMLASNARGPGSALALSISWIFGFITASSFGYMTTILGIHWTFWIYAVVCAMAFVFTAVIVPETRGKTLNEIQHMLSK